MPQLQKRRRKEARPDEIISAALTEFRANGFAGTSIGKIAARAGIARSTVYLYFETKESIFEAAIELRLGATLSEARNILALHEDKSFDVLFERLLRNYYDRIVDTDASVLLQILIAEGRRFPDLVSYFQTNMLGNIERMLANLISQGVEMGQVRPEIIHNDLKVIFAPAVLAVIWNLIFEERSALDTERYFQSHLDLILNGLRS